MSDKQARYAYLGVLDGICQGVCVDEPNKPFVKQFVARYLKAGGHVDRVAIEVARTALFEPWPSNKEPVTPSETPA